ncbi:TlpA family protein disulfide reductase [Quadrisphaera setariae]|uniref:TlpA family protein disulfide reductase n=1 Tax=Quadrisphaera setariae TaxID=2593304 RepID=A0A5C8Z5F7_9ACTN|nr:TlpA family protein disulfide reductase [Streptomyces sp. NP160]TXR52503.1 TlpA family protein disulfide reductase [Quadrisphaera setariae]
MRRSAARSIARSAVWSAAGPAARRGRAPKQARVLWGAGLVALSVTLSSCAGLGVQGDDGSQQGFVAGDGTWELVAETDRTDAVQITGPGSDGSTVDVSALRGHVVVINVWYAACAPCRVEAPDLAAAAREYSEAGVRFVGINTRDGLAAANTFERQFSVPYPSVMDSGSGQALLALRGVVPPLAVPTTIVLDRQGRPAGRIVGRADPGVLRGMIEQVAGLSSVSPSAGAGQAPTSNDAASRAPSAPAGAAASLNVGGLGVGLPITPVGVG